MLPACRIGGEGFAIPTFDLVPSDVEGFMEELWEFQATFHDCFARSEPRAHFFDLTGCKFSVAQRLRSSAQIEGDRIRRERGAKKNAWDSEPA